MAPRADGRCPLAGARVLRLRRALVFLALAGAGCAGARPSPLAVSNLSDVLGSLETLTGQYESFGVPKADVTACRHKFTAVRDAARLERWDESEARLAEAVACTRAIGDDVSAMLDRLRANDHINMDLKVFIGKNVDFGQGLYKLVRINWTPKGDSVRYDLELQAIPSGLLRTYSFMLR
ncbi:MAG: hypothetical protein U0610_32355 [bacterium]